MIKEFQFRIKPEQVQDQELLYRLVEQNLTHGKLEYVRLLKRSLDARKTPIFYNVKVEAYIDQPYVDLDAHFQNIDVSNATEVVIVGAGPAGLFAALQAIQLGIRPVIYERGKDVRSRRRDLAKIHKEHLVNGESNYCFGEGGAGTYSDGKLYTRSKKRGDVEKVLQWLVDFGAKEDIKIDAHPHIGTNRLPGIITNIREAILKCGGEIHFESKMTDLFVDSNHITGIEINGQEKKVCDHLILATGHSARDIYQMLYDKGIALEAKSFALGVRIEHDQDLIDKIQYHGQSRGEDLPPASYSLVSQVEGKGVYSFCMCPGGIVAPCATDQGEVVTNGWSPSKRNNPYSNSGIVVQLAPEDISDDWENNPLVCLEFQKSVEHACWEAAGKTQAVPAQRLVDFLDGKVSNNLPQTSYQPGLVSVDLNKILPEIISRPLKKAFRDFGKKMKGFLTNEAVLHAPESRTSSPVRIPRDKETMMHPEVQGLYPCAEGAGYAGGIVSAAVDGMNCIQTIAAKKKFPNS